MPKKLSRTFIAPLWVLLLAACGPLQGMVVQVTLTGVPGGATTVMVSATLNGQPAQMDSTFPIPPDTVSVVLQPLPAAGSVLSLSITASDGTETTCADGAGQITLMGQPTMSLTIALVSCPQWNSVPSGTTQPLSQVWGTAVDDVWAVGDMGTALHWHGSDWTDMSTATSYPLSGVWSSSPDDVWAVGNDGGVITPKGVILHFTGALPWTPQMLPAIPPVPPINGVWGSSSKTVWAVGMTGSIWEYTGSQWGPGGAPTIADLYQVSGLASAALAVGDGGTVVTLGAGTPAAGSAGTTVSLRGVWVSPLGTVWAVGDMGTILQRPLKGTWTKMKTDASVTATLNGIFGFDDADIWAVGALGTDGMGTLLHWDGVSWKSVLGGSTQPLSGVWGSSAVDVWAVGAAGTILHFSR